MTEKPTTYSERRQFAEALGRIDELKAEIKTLRRLRILSDAEIRELKDENKKLKDENKKLKAGK